MSGSKKYDVAVIGSGPGGYVAAIRAAQHGLKTALIEKSDNLGGVCLNWGCIPSKALLKSAEMYEKIGNIKEFGLGVDNLTFDWSAVMKRSRQISQRVNKGVAYLMKKNEIEVISGRAKLKADKTIEIEGGEPVSADNIIIATGAHARAVPGIEPDGGRIITSREAIVLEKLPESAVIIGAGAIGMEFAYLWSTFGCRVSVIELEDRILPFEDREITEELKKIFLKKKIDIQTSSKVAGVEADENSCTVHLTDSDGANPREINAETVLVSIGVAGNVDNLGLEEAGVEVERGFIKTRAGYLTSAAGIYAIGDCIGAPLLAHAASAEAEAAVGAIVGKAKRKIDPLLVPSCTYCLPQVASVGLTEEKAVALGHDISVGRFPFRPLGKALVIGERDGMVKIVAEKTSGKILGVHILGAEATEMIPEATVALNCALDSKSLESIIHPHPTLSEAIMEAAGDVTGSAVHL